MKMPIRLGVSSVTKKTIEDVMNCLCCFQRIQRSQIMRIYVLFRYLNFRPQRSQIQSYPLENL